GIQRAADVLLQRTLRPAAVCHEAVEDVGHAIVVGVPQVTVVELGGIGRVALPPPAARIAAWGWLAVVATPLIHHQERSPYGVQTVLYGGPSSILAVEP